MDRLETYLAEVRGQMAEMKVLTRQLYHQGYSRSLSDSIIMLLRTTVRSSRFMNLPDIGNLARAMEDFFVSISQQESEFNFLRSRLVSSCMDAICSALDSVGLEGQCSLERLDDLVKALQAAALQEVFVLESFQQESLTILDEMPEIALERGETAVEVPVERIQGLLHTYDMLLGRHIQLCSRLGMLEDKLAAEEGVRLLLPGIRESLAVLDEHTAALQEQLLALGQRPLQTVLEQVHTHGLDIIRRLRKQVDLEVPSTDIRMDSAILSSLSGILLEVVDNSILHGIEDSQLRIDRGKRRRGLVTVMARQQASRIIICIQDDGMGLDFDKLKEQVVELGLARQDEVDVMARQELTRFLFMPEFSVGKNKLRTAGKMDGGGESQGNSECNGLDKVGQAVDALRGSVTMTSTPGVGTSIEISLPDSLLAQEGVFVQVGGWKFMVLSHYVEEIVNVRRTDIIQSNTKQFLPSGRELVPLYNPAMLLGRGAAQSVPMDFCTVMMVVQHGKKQGLLIDDVLYYKKVLTKPLPPVMAGLKWIQAVVLDENHHLVPILHLPSLLSRLHSVRDYAVRSFEVSNRVRLPRVLVVEDSATTREIERMILESESFQVVVARDGIEALDILRKGWFDLVVTDIAMPRMDGLVLIRNIRRLHGYEDVPVVVVSSDVDKDMEEKVRAAGGQGCIAKFQFQRGKLVSLVRELLDG